MPCRPAFLPLAAAMLAFGAGAAAQSDTALPDIGSSAASVISPAEQSEYGAMMLGELRRLGYVLDDPLLDSYLDSIAYRLVEVSDQPDREFTFFFLRDRNINAFATLGGYVGVNTGLLLGAEREDEAASVLAHEIAHVTHNHVLRGVERQQQDLPLIALGMIGAMLAAQQAGGDGDATQAAMASGMALMQQRAINYTRSNESEADRVGIRMLARAGYDPHAAADFFQTMQRVTRSAGPALYPDYLRTHPITITRISEAEQRAERIAVDTTPVPMARETVNPLLPQAFSPSAGTGGGEDTGSGLFLWARERARVFSYDSPTTLLAEYRAERPLEGEAEDARQYGYALVETRTGHAGSAVERLTGLSEKHPGFFWIDLALAEAEHRAGRGAMAQARYDRLLTDQPGSRAIALSYADALLERGDEDAGRRALAVLRPLTAAGSDDVTFQQTYARAAQLAGDIVRAGEAYAEAAFLSGRAEDALGQLQRLKQRSDLNYYERSRIDARIARLTPYVLELRRRGFRPGDADRGIAGDVALTPTDRFRAFAD